MENTQSEIVESLDSLKELNSKLLAQIDELRKENVNVKAENAKLKQALEEHESRFTNLERRDEEKSNTLAKLEYDVSLIKEESLQDNNTTSVSKEIPVSSETYQESIQKTSFSSENPTTEVSISDEETKSRVSNSSIPLESSIDSKKILEAEISEEAKKMSLPESERNQVINKLTMRFTDSPKLDKDYSIDKEGEHQSDSYWIFGSRCPICRGNHMSLQEPGISIDEVLEAYPENSKPIQELKTQRFTSPIPWNKALIFPNKNIAVEA
nr:2102_t:CDS:2 [Entrophospora candida]